MNGSVNAFGTLSGSVSIKRQNFKLSPEAKMTGNVSNQLINPDYEDLKNLPTINGVLVKGNLTSKDLLIERGYDATVDPENDEHLILST